MYRKSLVAAATGVAMIVAAPLFAQAHGGGAGGPPPGAGAAGGMHSQGSMSASPMAA